MSRHMIRAHLPPLYGSFRTDKLPVVSYAPEPITEHRYERAAAHLELTAPRGVVVVIRPGRTPWRRVTQAPETLERLFRTRIDQANPCTVHLGVISDRDLGMGPGPGERA